MKRSKEKPLLSLDTRFDDLMQDQRAFFDQYKANFDASVALANSYEKIRRKYNHVLTELFLLKHENEQLHGKLQVVNHQIGSVLKALTKKTSEYNKLKDVKEKMSDKLRTIQTVVNEKETFKKPKSNFVNAKKPLPEENDLEERSNSSESTVITNAYDDYIQNSIIGRCSSKTCDHCGRTSPSSSVSKPSLLENTRTIKSDQPSHQSHSMSKNNKYGFSNTQNFHCHKLQLKEVRTQNMICFPCGKRISFCSKAIFCYRCNTVCHQNCQQKLEFPCVPQ